jgi:hypothetical protein
MAYTGPGKYRHYKGGEYEAIGLALHESELYQLVIYRPLTPGSKLEGSYDKPLPVHFWARPLSDFNAVVDIHGGPIDRFSRIE